MIARRTVRDSLLHALWIFACWSTLRILLGQCIARGSGYYDVLLPIVTDVEIHSLKIHPGGDLLVFLFLAGIAAIAQAMRRKQILFPAVGAVAVAGSLGIAMVYYPALTLSGRIGSPFVGPARPMVETIAFSLAAIAILAAAALAAQFRIDDPSSMQDGDKRKALGPRPP